MKNLKSYIFSSLIILIIISLSACKNTPEKENAHTEEEAHKYEPGEEHSEGEADKDEHGEEIILSAQQFEALQMRIDTLEKRKISGYVEANGQLEVPPQNEATVTSVVGANVVSIEVVEGDKINKGQVLAYLSHPNIIEKQTQYLEAYTNRELQKKEFERQQKLYNAGVGSGANFQKAEAQYQTSKSLVNGLEAQLQQLSIDVSGVQSGKIYQRVALRSPIEGYLEEVNIKTGQYVDPQTDLFEVVNTHHVHADLMVFEKDVHKIKKGQHVRFTVQSIPGKELKAKIYSVGKVFEQNPKALHVHAEIENKEGNLIPGMYIKGRIETDNTQVNALPESAIGNEGDKFYAFIAEKEGENWSFKPVEIITGAKDGEWVAVQFLEPLKPNTLLAYNNAYYLLAELKKGEAGHSH